jgi:hypothetical protein
LRKRCSPQRHEKCDIILLLFLLGRNTTSEISNTCSRPFLLKDISNYTQMATLDYVDIPAAATRLQSRERTTDLRPAIKIATGLPHPDKVSRSVYLTPTTEPMSPSKLAGFNFSQVLLSSAISLPANAPSAPRASKGAPKLLSTRDPLSIPITTVNFKRFVSKAGPVFWLQDRVEEIVMWRKGWKFTSVWMAGYAFLCACGIQT